MCHELDAYSIVCYEMCHDHDTFLDTEKVCQECQITLVFDWFKKVQVWSQRILKPEHRLVKQIAKQNFRTPPPFIDMN